MTRLQFALGLGVCLWLTLVCAPAGSAQVDCGPMQRLKVKQQWFDVWGSQKGTKHGKGVGFVILKALVRLDRSFFDLLLKDLYDPRTLLAALARGIEDLDLALTLLDDDPLLQNHLAHRRVNLMREGVGPGDRRWRATLIKRVLMQSIPALLVRCFDADAWSACCDVMVDGLGMEEPDEDYEDASYYHDYSYL